MPHRNVIRSYTENAKYHCYNRGVEQRHIFLDEIDYGVFLQRLRFMLAPPEEIRDEISPDRIRVKSFYGDVKLLAYCLMPNHFHLLLHQDSAEAIPEFMRSLSTSYTMYFNKRYDRVGSLFQGRYKARMIDSDSYNLHISRYIHLNPLHLSKDIESYEYSSLQYLKDTSQCPSWLSVHELLLDHNDNYADYMRFVREYADTEKLKQLDEKFTLA